MAETKDILIDYVLHLADNSMILGQRNAEWCGHGPVLEQDIALTNITLDLIGEARSLYQYAAELKGGDSTEDSMAFLRDVTQYRNTLLLEQNNTDWAYTITRQFFYDVFHYYLQEALINSSDERLKEIAKKLDFLSLFLNCTIVTSSADSGICLIAYSILSFLYISKFQYC